MDRRDFIKRGVVSSAAAAAAMSLSPDALLGKAEPGTCLGGLKYTEGSKPFAKHTAHTLFEGKVDASILEVIVGEIDACEPYAVDIMTVPEGIEVASVYSKYGNIDAMVEALPEHFVFITPNLVTVKEQSMLCKLDFASVRAGTYGVINGDVSFASCDLICSRLGSYRELQEVLTSSSPSSFNATCLRGMDANNLIVVGEKALHDELWLCARYTGGYIGNGNSLDIFNIKGLKSMSAQVICVPL